MLRNLRFRTKLMLIVLIPIIAAIVVAVPGLRTRLHDKDASAQALAQVGPAAQVQSFLNGIDDEGSLSAWWVASGDAAVQSRLRAARVATDRAARTLVNAEHAANRAGATDAGRGIHDLRESVALLGQQRQFVDLRLTPDGSVLGYFRDVGRNTTGILDAFAGAPQGAAAAIMFRDEATLARLQSALADERSILTVAFSRHVLQEALATDLVAAVTTQNAALNELESQGRPATRAAVRTGVDSFRTATDRVRQGRAPALANRLLPASVTAGDWYDTATAQLSGWQTLGARITTGINHDLARRQDDTRSNLLAVGIGSVAVLLLAAGLAFVIARATTRPLRQLADNAHDVATRQLPALVDALHDPRAEPPTITPIVVESRDELGELAKAFNHVERTMVEVADLQRDTVRTGISELYVNLARRNQPLLKRQLTLIEDLEGEERDPDRLGALFALDHLATRMRRNSDSLLVLAGVDEKSAGRPAVPLLDVVRGAVSETTDFQRIDTAGIAPDVEVVGYAATDLAHLLSELLENATSFSTPASRVTVISRPAASGLELMISDKGIGIPVERMQALNLLLADPPPPGLVLSRSLGLVVVARLAQRIGVRVTLHSASDVGTAAVLTLPASILHTAPTAHTPAIDLVAEEDAESIEVDATDVAAGVPAAASTASTAVPAVAPAAAPADPDVLPRRGQLDDTTTAGLPRRPPPGPPSAEVPTTVAAPPRRPADAVFELVARYQAGRRRAQSQPTDTNEERP